MAPPGYATPEHPDEFGTFPIIDAWDSGHGDLGDVGRARRFVQRVLTRERVPAQVVDDAVLCVSEAVTNAMRHGGGLRNLRAAVTRGVVRLEVEDAAPGQLSIRWPEPTATSGRGLLIIDQLATRWGVAPADGGKQVWIELAAHDAGDPPRGSSHGRRRQRGGWAGRVVGRRRRVRAQLLHQVNELVEALAAVELRGNAIAEVERLAATAVGGDWARLHPALPAAIDAATDAEHAVIGLEGSHRYRAMELHVPRWLLRIPAQECKAFLRSVADACGHALERVELLYAERRARADLELLASASRGLAASLEPAKVVATLEEVLVPRLATRCEVVLGDEAKRSTPLPGTIAVDLEWAGRPVGQLRLQPRRDEFDESARDLLDELATRAAAALDNARLYEERATTSALLEASLLPHALLPVDNLELGGRYLAALAGHVVGGDFYDAMRTPDGRAVLIVGDVQGKGVEAATLTALARHTLRAGALAGDGPVAMLERLNAAIRYDQEERDAVAPDTIMRFVTAAVAELTPMATGFRARIAAAGHPRPIVVRPDGHVDHVEAKGPLLGLFEVADLVEATVHMGLSDLLVLYTDGVVEHRAAAELFDELELGRLVRNLLTTSRADDIAGVILDTVLALAPSESRDDIAILVARVTGPR